MDAWWWVAIGFAAWCGVSLPVALWLGLVLRHCSQAREGWEADIRAMMGDALPRGI